MVDYIIQQTKQSPLSIAIDFHYGFGLKDRLWFPWGKNNDPYPNFILTQKYLGLG